jgi:hypothetical protein
VYVLELFSGHGSVSATASRILDNCPVVTVDESNAHGKPIVCAVLPRDNQVVIDRCRELYPDRSVIIWASPECREYSRAKTLGVRDLITADANVRAVRDIAAALRATLVIIENPATGLLKERDVIRFMPHSEEVHYCQYARTYKKPTMLWFSRDLCEYGFKPKICHPDCKMMIKGMAMKRHIWAVSELSHADRISVPNELVVDVFHAVKRVVDSIPVKAFDPRQPRAARAARADHWEREVEMIMRVRGEGDHVELLVVWKGLDHRQWILADHLDGSIQDFEDHEFADESVRAECMRLCS